MLVDEAHRTTGGDLGNYLMGAMPNATYLGFTGTPIDHTAYGKGTFKVFGIDDSEGLLDKYSISGVGRGRHDGAAPLLARPERSAGGRETLEKEFLDLAEVGGRQRHRGTQPGAGSGGHSEEHAQEPGAGEKVAGSSPSISAENVEPMGYKAFLVAVDREACVLYKKALDKYPAARVFHGGHQQRGEEGPDSLRRVHLTGIEEKEFAEGVSQAGERLPKILIVTEKLLTGFDAPILYCMYLDKPMRDHVLLQAIARSTALRG